VRIEPPVPPAAMATTIVSPMAREMPMMSAATIPDTAAGTTTLRLVVTLRAPRPYDASRRLRGTARSASSEIEAMSGMIRMPTPRPAASMLNTVACGQTRWTMLGLMNVRAKKPRTTLGMLARISRIGFTKDRVRGEAYSER